MSHCMPLASASPKAWCRTDTTRTFKNLTSGPRTAAPAVLVKKFEQHSQRCLCEADNSVCDPSLPTGLTALQALGRSRPRLKNPPWLTGFEPKTFQPGVWNTNNYSTGAGFLLPDLMNPYYKALSQESTSSCRSALQPNTLGVNR